MSDYTITNEDCTPITIMKVDYYILLLSHIYVYSTYIVNYSTSFEVHKHTMQLASYQHLLTCELIWLIERVIIILKRIKQEDLAAESYIVLYLRTYGLTCMYTL